MPARWISWKPEVRVTPASLALAEQYLRVAAECAPELHDQTLVLTSGGEPAGGHQPDSMHYAQAAWDIRTHPNDDGTPRTGAIVSPAGMGGPQLVDFIDNEAARWARRIQKRLGAPHQVVYEKPRRHIHAEIDYDP